MTRSPIMRRSPNGIPAKVISAKNTEKKRRQVVEGLVGIGWNNILLPVHLHEIGYAMERSEHPKTEDGRTIRANAVLNEGRLFALHPGVKSREVQRSEKDDSRQDELDDHHFDHFLDC